MAIDHSALENEISRLGAAFREAVKGEMPSLFNPLFWHGRLLEWAMEDPEFKTDLFRFVDVLPALETSAQVAQHVREYLSKEGRKSPVLRDLMLTSAGSGILAPIAAGGIRKSIEQMAERFMIGKDIEDALPFVRRLSAEGFLFTVDILGEATLSDREARAYRDAYLNVISRLADEMNGPDKGPAARQGGAAANVSLKVSALDPQLDSVDPKGCAARLMEMALPLFLHAKERNVFINLDMEQRELREITHLLFESAALHPEMKEYPHIGIVVQAYLKDAARDLDRLLSLARRRGTPFTVRLVKGAYWDYETAVARQRGLPSPVFIHKSSTDANYEKLTLTLLENRELLRPAFGSHNRRSLLNSLAAANIAKVPHGSFELQMLYGMAEPERDAFRKMGESVRLYAPVGEFLPGIGYLVRRLLENTSNTGFLRLSYHGEEDRERLLARPVPVPETGSEGKQAGLSAPFTNAPVTDFADPEIREIFASAVEKLPTSLPMRVPVVVEGGTRFGGAKSKTVCPSDRGLVVCEAAVPTVEEADAAVRSAMRSWDKWRDTAVEERAAVLETLADILERDRFALAALETYEVAKPWREADADIAEAIDFCRYYARQALEELAPRRQTDIPGEDNLLLFEGRGPTLIIAPWNFPVAILAGMTVAALVSGNTVIVKPSGKSCASGYAFFQRLMEAGVPAGVGHFLPGAGETAGDLLVRHPLVAQIAFTGSKEVGLSIVEKAAKTLPGQKRIKRVVCEMGGKNAVIIDEDADLDEAVAGVIRSALGYAGQKCSACSRVIAVGERVYGIFVKRFSEACGSIAIEGAHQPGCKLGPVVDEGARRRLMETIRNPGEGALPLYVGDRGTAPETGYFVPPALFAVADAGHPLMQEELFGPIVVVMKANDFDHALEIAAATEFALTGGVYSRLPSSLSKARAKFRVGNLYLNRAITGALVHRQPFGGFAMSGLGTKAGGPGYLLNFAEPRSISENTMRRGFSPEKGGADG